MTLDLFQSKTTISWLASHRVITYGPKQKHRSVLRRLFKNNTFVCVESFFSKRLQHLCSPNYKRCSELKQKQATLIYLMNFPGQTAEIFCSTNFYLPEFWIQGLVQYRYQTWGRLQFARNLLTSVSADIQTINNINNRSEQFRKAAKRKPINKMRYHKFFLKGKIKCKDKTDGAVCGITII